MREAVILAVALAVGAGVAFGLREVLHTTGVALAAGIVTGWIVWGEIGDRLGGSGEAEAGDRPILFDPARRRRIIGAAALVLAVVFIIGDFALGDLETDDIREWGEGLG
ncbi:MAG: hypothetical protein F4081_05415, partial [Dehalococcoidia bacterium]|nr:hypothetical protein [Dehalococcoidia bacterium]